jgi:hypothetical protein
VGHNRVPLCGFCYGGYGEHESPQRSSGERVGYLPLMVGSGAHDGAAPGRKPRAPGRAMLNSPTASREIRAGLPVDRGILLAGPA